MALPRNLSRRLPTNLCPGHRFTETTDWATFEAHCCTIAQEAVLEVAETAEIQDVIEAAKKNAAQAKQKVWAKLLLDHIKYDNADLCEIVFLDRVVWAAKGK